MVSAPKNRYKFKFSFVMPVYNVEKYLPDTIDSILNQTLDFEENCEIILINDGSPDNVEEVCLRYQRQFPNNIKYIKQTNQGVSAARNRGLKKVEGKYVSFLDPDDKISSNTLKEVYEFFEANVKRIDFVSIKIDFFEAKTGPHPLNYKFTASRVVDVREEYDAAQLSAASAFVKAEIFSHGRHQFDTGLKTAEDAKLLTEVLIEKLAYGIVHQPTYYYRKRVEGGSAIDSSSFNRGWYFTVPERVYEYILELGRQHKALSRYAQYLVMYDLRSRFKQTDENMLSEKDIKRYKQILFGLVGRIDDDIILKDASILSNYRRLHNEYKYFLLGKKYKESVALKSRRKGWQFVYRGNPIYDYSKAKPKIQLYKLLTRDNRVNLEGMFTGFLFKDVSVKFRMEDKWYDVEYVERPAHSIYFLGDLVHTRNYFTVSLPLTYQQSVSAFVIVGEEKKKLPIVVDMELGDLDEDGSYVVKKEAILLRIDSFLIMLQKNNPYRRVVRRVKSLMIYFSKRKTVVSSKQN